MKKATESEKANSRNAATSQAQTRGLKPKRLEVYEALSTLENAVSKSGTLLIMLAESVTRASRQAHDPELEKMADGLSLLSADAVRELECCFDRAFKLANS